jgi:para-aminobenzoate synthetase/4-amino-4-deoxychorismate lyase
MVFNVPIRTIEIDTKLEKGWLGLGSGVVWESDPAEEYNEVKLKGEFLTNPVGCFELIESMLIEGGTLFLKDNHLNRLKKSADFFLFKFDQEKLLQYIDAVIKECESRKKYKLRISMDKWGHFTHTLDEITDSFSGIDICISETPVSSGSKFLYFKTTNRALYEKEFKINREKGFEETIFLNENAKLTEGCRTNIFIRMNDKLLTPPVDDGLLEGCYRQYLLDGNNHAEEKSLDVNDIINADNCILVNSVRKEISVRRIFRNGALLKEY